MSKLPEGNILYLCINNPSVTTTKNKNEYIVGSLYEYSLRGPLLDSGRNPMPYTFHMYDFKVVLRGDLFKPGIYSQLNRETKEAVDQLLNAPVAVTSPAPIKPSRKMTHKSLREKCAVVAFNNDTNQSLIENVNGEWSLVPSNELVPIDNITKEQAYDLMATGKTWEEVHNANNVGE